MRNGFLRGTAVFSAVSERSGNPGRADGVEPVRVLYDPSFHRFRAPVPVFAEGYRIDNPADFVRRFRTDVQLFTVA